MSIDLNKIKFHANWLEPILSLRNADLAETVYKEYKANPDLLKEAIIGKCEELNLSVGAVNIVIDIMIEKVKECIKTKTNMPESINKLADLCIDYAIVYFKNVLCKSEDFQVNKQVVITMHSAGYW